MTEQKTRQPRRAGNQPKTLEAMKREIGSQADQVGAFREMIIGMSVQNLMMIDDRHTIGLDDREIESLLELNRLYRELSHVILRHTENISRPKMTGDYDGE